MRAVSLCVALGLLCVAVPASGQRLLEEWQARTSAGAEALVGGAAAVFWNPAQVSVTGGRIEAIVLNLRGPGITGVEGLATAAAYALDGGTVVALGYDHVGVDGIQRTDDSPDGGSPIDVGENRFAVAASHELSGRLRVGAMVRYTRLPEVSLEQSVIALGAGVRHRPLEAVPVEIAAMAATEGEEAYWMAGVDLAPGLPFEGWTGHVEYGAAGGQLAPGVTHRLAGTAGWRELAEVTVGAVVEPDGGGRTLQPVLGVSLAVDRYRLGMVREQLPNDFGSAYSFRFAVVF